MVNVSNLNLYCGLKEHTCIPIYISAIAEIHCNPFIVFFKCLGSRHLQKEIKIHKCVCGINYILCKTDIKPIHRLTYNCNILKDVHFKVICIVAIYTILLMF